MNSTLMRDSVSTNKIGGSKEMASEINFYLPYVPMYTHTHACEHAHTHKHIKIWIKLHKVNIKMRPTGKEATDRKT